MQPFLKLPVQPWTEQRPQEKPLPLGPQDRLSAGAGGSGLLLSTSLAMHLLRSFIRGEILLSHQLLLEADTLFSQVQPVGGLRAPSQCRWTSCRASLAGFAQCYQGFARRKPPHVTDTPLEGISRCVTAEVCWKSQPRTIAILVSERNYAVIRLLLPQPLPRVNLCKPYS